MKTMHLVGVIEEMSKREYLLHRKIMEILKVITEHTVMNMYEKFYIHKCEKKQKRL